MRIFRKVFHHVFHPFTTYENSNQKLSLFQGIVAIALGYYTSALAIARQIPHPFTRNHPYITGLGVFYLATAVFKYRLPKYVPKPTQQTLFPPPQKPIAPPKLPSPSISTNSKPKDNDPKRKSLENYGTQYSLMNATQAPPTKAQKVHKTTPAKILDATAPSKPPVSWPWQSGFYGIPIYFSLDTKNPDKAVESLKEILPAITNTTTISGDSWVNFYQNEIQKIISNASSQCQDFTGKSQDEQLELIYKEFSKNLGLNHIFLKIISEYHPCLISKRKFKEFASKKTAQDQAILTKDGLNHVLFLFGFFKRKSVKWKDIPSIKGSVNSKTFYGNKPVDFIPTSKFVLLNEDKSGFEESELKQLSQRGTYIYSLQPFNHDDADVISGKTTIDEFHKKNLDPILV